MGIFSRLKKWNQLPKQFNIGELVKIVDCPEAKKYGIANVKGVIIDTPWVGYNIKIDNSDEVICVTRSMVEYQTKGDDV